MASAPPPDTLRSSCHRRSTWRDITGVKSLTDALNVTEKTMVAAFVGLAVVAVAVTDSAFAPLAALAHAAPVV